MFLENKECDVLTKPFTTEEILNKKDEFNYISGAVYFNISDMIDYDYESFLDMLSESLVGNDLLMDINYEMIGIRDDSQVILSVTGDVSSILEILAEDEYETGDYNI